MPEQQISSTGGGSAPPPGSSSESSHSGDQKPATSDTKPSGKVLAELKEKIKIQPFIDQKSIDAAVKASAFNIHPKLETKHKFHIRPNNIAPEQAGGYLAAQGLVSRPTQGFSGTGGPEDSIGPAEPLGMLGGEAVAPASTENPGEEEPEEDPAAEGDGDAPASEENNEDKDENESGDDGEEASDGEEPGVISPAQQRANEFIAELEQNAAEHEKDEIEKMKKGNRPSAEYIFKQVEKLLPQLKWQIRVIKWGIKYILNEDIEEIAEIIWPQKVPILVYLADPPASCLQHANKPKLATLVLRILLKVTGIVFAIFLVLNIFFGAILFTTICVYVKQSSIFDPTGAAVKTISYWSGLTDICNKATSGAGGGSSSSGSCGTAVTKPRHFVFIHYAQAQNNACYNGPIGTGVWKDLINKYSNQSGVSLDPCILTTLVAKESHGDPNAIGHDSHSASSDPFQGGSPPKFGLNWQHSHGIGLTQPTIFPNGNANGGAWPDPNVPQRTFDRKNWYNVEQLLKPDINLDVAARYFSSLLKSENGNVQGAFGRYNGSGIDGDYAKETMMLYNNCKLQPIGGL